MRQKCWSVRETNCFGTAWLLATAASVGLMGRLPSARAAGVPTTGPVAVSQDDDAELRDEVRLLKSKLDAVEAREAARDRADAARDQAMAAAKPGVAPGALQRRAASSYALTPAGDAGASSGDVAPAVAGSAADSVASLDPSTETAVEQDAARRSEAFDLVGMNAGYIPNKGFVIKSDDDAFLLHPWAYFQGRYVANYRQDGSSAGQTDSGFEIARLKFVLDGNVFSKDLTYQFIWNTVKSGGGLQLNDGWVQYRFSQNPDLTVTGGQLRNALDHEQIVFATQSLTVDRSLVDDLLANGEGFVDGVGVTAGYDVNGPLRAKAIFSHGMRNYDMTFQDFPTNVASYGVSARVDWKLMGDWQNYDRFTALNVKKDLLVLGAGADYTEAGSTGSITHVVDAQYDAPCGLSAYAAYLGRYTKQNGGLPGTDGGSNNAGAFPDTYDATGRVMVAYLFPDHFEPFVRYEYLQFDPKELTGYRYSTVHDITLGGNYYFYGQRAKFAANVIYLPNGCPVTDNAVNDILGESRGGNEVVFQAQFQLIL